MEEKVNNLKRFDQVFNNLTKSEARKLLRNGEHDLTPEQTKKILNDLQKGSADRINLKVLKNSGEARLSIKGLAELKDIKE